MIICPGTFPIMVKRAVPPWRYVAAKLRQRIAAGEFPPGAPLPSLSALAIEYGVSQSTCRKAINSLVSDGLVETVPGWGAFLKESPPGG